MNDQLVAETFYLTTLLTDIHATGGIRIHDLSRQGAADQRFRTRAATGTGWCIIDGRESV